MPLHSQSYRRVPPIRIHIEISAHFPRKAKNNSEILFAGCALALTGIGDTEVDEILSRGEVLTPRAVFDQVESNKKKKTYFN